MNQRHPDKLTYSYREFSDVYARLEAIAASKRTSITHVVQQATATWADRNKSALTPIYESTLHEMLANGLLNDSNKTAVLQLFNKTPSEVDAQRIHVSYVEFKDTLELLRTIAARYRIPVTEAIRKATAAYVYSEPANITPFKNYADAEPTTAKPEPKRHHKRTARKSSRSGPDQKARKRVERAWGKPRGTRRK